MPLASVTAHWLAGWRQTEEAPSPLHHPLPLHHHKPRERVKRRPKIPVYLAKPIVFNDNDEFDVFLKKLNQDVMAVLLLLGEI